MPRRIINPSYEELFATLGFLQQTGFWAAGAAWTCGRGSFPTAIGAGTKGGYGYVVHTENGDREIPRAIDSRPLAASYGAVQHFIGERNFKEILFKNGLPRVFVFDGPEGNPNDGTVVVVGDIAPLFGGKKTTGVLFKTVQSFKELATKDELRTRLAALPDDAVEERAQLMARAEVD